jgi:hypothetical protein
MGLVLLPVQHEVYMVSTTTVRSLDDESDLFSMILLQADVDLLDIRHWLGISQ